MVVVDSETTQEMSSNEKMIVALFDDISYDDTAQEEENPQMSPKLQSDAEMEIPPEPNKRRNKPIEKHANPITHTWGNDGHQSTLSANFDPPYHLLHGDEGFEFALTVARKRRCLLLVNVQNYSDNSFGCFAINRDIWRDELVQDLIRTSFVFWHTDVESRDGAAYARHFSVQQFPHVAIINPFLRNIVWGLSGWTIDNPWMACDMAQILTEIGFDKFTNNQLLMSAKSLGRDPFVADPEIEVSREYLFQHYVLEEEGGEFMTAEQIEDFSQLQLALATSVSDSTNVLVSSRSPRCMN